MSEFGGSGITEELFNLVRSLLPDQKHILEIGGGMVSTRFLSQHYRLTTVEQDAKYINMYPGVRYIHAPIVRDTHPDTPEHENWYDVSALTSLPTDYDLLLVDGPGCQSRMGFHRHIDLFNTAVPIVIDDTHRESEIILAKAIAAKYSKTIQWHDQFALLT